jgi:hypothetical protein
MQAGAGLPTTGGADLGQVVDFQAARARYRGENCRVPEIVRRSHSFMAKRILDLLGNGEGDGEGEGTTIIVGHDTDMDAIGALFGMSWSSSPWPADASTPGSAVRFDLEADGKTVQASLVFQVFDGPSPPMRTVPAAFTWRSGASNTTLAELTARLMAPGRFAPECVPRA